MRSRLIQLYAFVVMLVTQVHCGASGDGVQNANSYLSKRSIFDGNDKLLVVENYFYDSNVTNNEDPTRIEGRQPDKSGNLALASMTEIEVSSHQRERLDTKYDLQNGKEIFRLETTETLDYLGGEPLVVKKEQRRIQGSTSSTETTVNKYVLMGDEPRLVSRKRVVDDVPERTESIKYDELGRPVKLKVVDGDGKIVSHTNVIWPNGQLNVINYNAAGREVSQGNGTVIYEFGELIFTELINTGSVIKEEVLCNLNGRKLTCKESLFDRISGEKISFEESTSIVGEDRTTKRRLEEKHERYRDAERVLLVADEWSYRNDRQVKLQVHSVESKNEAALVQFEDEFSELYDFRHLIEYDNLNNPVREHKETGDPRLERIVVYEY